MAGGSSDSTQTAERAWQGLALLGVVLLGGALRTVGLGFGLPLLHARPDESLILRTAVGFGSGDLNPHAFHYGTLLPYLLFAAYGGFFVLGLWTGRFASTADFVALYDFEPAPLLWIGRSLSMLAGTATIWVVARAGTALLDRTTGLVAATLLSVTYLHVRDSHFATTDVLLTAWLAGSLLFLARALESGRRFDYVAAGTLAGLAASTKYAGIFLLPAAVWVHGVRLRREGIPLRAGLDARALLGVAVLAGAFLLGTPFALLDAPAFLRDVLEESRHLADGHHVELARGWWQHVAVSLRYGMGLPLLIVSVLGIAGLCWRRPERGLLLAAFPIVYYATLATGRTVFVRYAIPLLPFLCIGAAFAVVEGGRALAGERHRLVPFVHAALIVGLAAPSLGRALSLDRLLLETDNRLVTRAYLERTLPSGSTIAQIAPGGFMEGPQWARVPLEPAPDELERELEPLVASGRSERRLRAWIAHLREAGGPVFVESFYSEATGRFESALGEPRERPRFLLIASHPVRRLPSPPEALWAEVSQHYRLLERFPVLEPGVERAFDHQDAFFVPYAGFAGAIRPGPEYTLYERISPGDPDRE